MVRNDLPGAPNINHVAGDGEWMEVVRLEATRPMATGRRATARVTSSPTPRGDPTRRGWRWYSGAGSRSGGATPIRAIISVITRVDAGPMGLEVARRELYSPAITVLV